MSEDHGILQPIAKIRETLEKNSAACWRNQDGILESMEEFAAGWFERRRVGTQAALEAARLMSGAESPAALISEYQSWATGAVERLIADSLAWQKHVMAVAGLVARSGPASDLDTPSPEGKSVPRGRSKA
jgi:hypothetical protein